MRKSAFGFFSFLASEMYLYLNLYEFVLCLECSTCILFPGISLADKVIGLANCG